MDDFDYYIIEFHGDQVIRSYGLPKDQVLPTIEQLENKYGKASIEKVKIFGVKGEKEEEIKLQSLLG